MFSLFCDDDFNKKAARILKKRTEKKNYFFLGNIQKNFLFGKK
jgi:hypothetical protein